MKKALSVIRFLLLSLPKFYIMNKMHVLYRVIGMIILSLISYVNVEGQNDSATMQKFHYIALSGGSSIPLSAFAPQFYGDYPPAYPRNYAKPGYAIILNASYTILKSNWNANILLGYNTNKFNTNSYLSFFSNPSNQVTGFSYEKGIYTQYYALIGPSYSFPIQAMRIQIRFLAGPLFFCSPEIIYNQTVSFNTPPPTTNIAYQEKYDTKSQELISFACNTGIGIRYLVDKKYIFLIDLDIYHSVKSNVLSTQYTRTENSTIIETKVAQSNLRIFIFTPSIGIGYKIEK